ncbi:MAG: outer membrane beta-barrel protein [Chitinophagaceae bacterium]
MKKYLLLIVFVSIMLNIFGQVKNKKKIFTTAIEAGYNTSTLYKKGTDHKSSYLHSFHAGILGTTNINWLNFEIGLFYSEKGGAISSTNNAYPYQKYKLSYIEVPINLLLKIPIGIILYPYVGVTLGGLIKADDITDAHQKINVYSELKKFDLMINSGIGVDIFGFNIRTGAVIGTQPIHTNGPKNLVFTIALSYIF